MFGGETLVREITWREIFEQIVIYYRVSKERVGKVTQEVILNDFERFIPEKGILTEKGFTFLLFFNQSSLTTGIPPPIAHKNLEVLFICNG